MAGSMFSLLPTKTSQRFPAELLPSAHSFPGAGFGICPCSFHEISAAHSSNLSRSLWLVAYPVVASPANLLTACFIVLSVLLIKLWNRTGLKLDLCGIPLIISFPVEYDSLSTKPSHTNRPFIFFCPLNQTIISLI